MNKNILLRGLFALFTIPFISSAQTVNSTQIIAGDNIAVASTEGGKVAGYIHNGIYTYKGIPYAHADRFMAPVKPAPWAGVRSTKVYGPACPMDPAFIISDESELLFQHNFWYPGENCQALNVWTPGLNDGIKRPVMVWIHGGGFTQGSSNELPSYDGENLTKKGDVVVVSLNHRLNVLGFLDLSAYGDKYKSSPNAGILDIVMALQWVKQNIAQFGGNPDDITIFGQSGGGGKITTLMAAPSAKGLFQKAIIESGSYVKSFMTDSLAKTVAAALLDELHLSPSQVDSLQKIPYDKLNVAGNAALRKVQAAITAKTGVAPTFGSGLGWAPILDGNFLPYQIGDPAALALSKDVPLLVGSNKNELFASLLNPAFKGFSMDDVKKLLKQQYGDKAEAYMDAVKNAYPNSTAKPSDYLDVDMRFRTSAINQANQHAAQNAAPVYMYEFTWQTPVIDGNFKAIHCLDIPFEFGNISRCVEMTGGGKEAYALSEKMSQAWINFAKTGNPNASSLPKWPAYTTADGATMIFDNVPEVKFKHDEKVIAIAMGK